ncbi:MAG: N-acetylmuramoyl-L-alanine amidase [Candidatus Bruticola sp.]
MPKWDNLALSAIMNKKVRSLIFLVVCLLCLGAIKGAWAEPADEKDGVSPVLIKIPDDSLGESIQSEGNSAPSDEAGSKVKSGPTKEAPAAQAPAKSKVKASKQSKSSSLTSKGFPWGKKYGRTSLKKHKSPSVPAPNEAPSPYKNNKNSSDTNSVSGIVKKASGASAKVNNIRRGRSSSPKQASADLPAQIVVGSPKNITVQAKGHSYPLVIRTTGIEDEYFVPIDAAGIKSIASLFGASSWTWLANSRTLSVTKNGRTNTLKVDQLKLDDSLGGRALDVGIREINGQYCCPVSILEDFLDVRVTIDNAKGKGWVEPLITSVRLDGSGSNLTLNVNASAPVSFSTFKLSKPDRYVIDIDGGVLDTSSLRVNHPEIGDIRLGQFTLGPAVSRIVVPTNSKLNITPPVSRTGTNFKFAISLPRTSVAQYKNEKVTGCEVGRFSSSGSVSSSVTIGFSGPVMYEWQRLAENKNRFVIDFKRVIFPENKITKKISGKLVEQVRISQYAAKPIPITRVVLDLSDAARVKVSEGRAANSIRLEISEDKINLDMAAMSGSGSLSGSYSYAAVGGGGKTICIDAGHGGSDSGCVSNAYGYMEKDVTLDICLKLAANLRRRGWNVILTRETDRDVTWAGSSNSQELGARVDIGAKGGADIFVSVHCNAAASSSAEGTSLHVYKRSDRALAECMHPHLMKASGRYDRGIQQDRFFVLVHSQMPAVLVETAFLSNSTEARLLGDPNYRQSIADGLADGVSSYASKYLNK